MFQWPRHGNKAVTSSPATASSRFAIGSAAWRRQRRLAAQSIATALCWPVRAEAQPSDSDFIGGTVLKLDVERGTVTLRHAAIAHLHLAAGIDVFRYFHPATVLRVRVGDGVRFRADRFDGSLRLLAVVSVGPSAPR